MSAVSLLEISNWNEEKFDVYLSKPELVDYFTVNYKLKKLSKDINALKYFDSNAKLNVFTMKSKFDNEVSKVLSVQDEVSLPVKQWVKDCSEKYIEDIEIVTFPSVLSTIMNTPFEISGAKKKWKLNATYESNKIFLIPINAEKTTLDVQRLPNKSVFSLPTNDEETTLDVQRLPNQYELLKRYLFVRKPEKLHCKVISMWDKLFYEVYQLNIGDNKVLYLSETPGVLSEQKLTSIDKLKTSEHIYCDVIDTGVFTQEVTNFNPYWWSRAQLINAKQCFIGIYNDSKKDLQEIMNFKTDKFDDITKFKHLWSPRAAWDFLDDVLSFIKDEVYRIDPNLRNQCSWEFRSYEKDRPFVTVIPYGPDEDTVPNDYIN